ncbi:hypothetical protein SAMD00019534_092960 [Acytostelium subglobosum LB1]|uniref:hypothetical protein n=1 Tax=Acytostelium subglobosum LB1 TaxID=1410327 RepID=UPI000644A505|nr:hypothetical protein SAMD00019534_092960 [Acytostelium subglobosum LB1]GAM26121.1 hypothetical protein SAMD00019534_092960 [Acytostelium subglobosum LB1]|eukprot:XP_012751164.1 hypothetical protein SAMD00019534_092960 [Acytostelium subglobosum LB1]
MTLISRVLSSKYIRSELFRHVLLIHRQLGITNVFHSSDVVSLYQCVQCGDTAKFIHHCDQLDISVHSPQELLNTINEAFYHALHRQNTILVRYIIERFKRGKDTTVAQLVAYIMNSLFTFNVKSRPKSIKLSRPMIYTLLDYKVVIPPSFIYNFVMRSALEDHYDLDWFTEMCPVFLRDYIFERYILIGYEMREFNPMFIRHQSRIIDDLHQYLKSFKPEDYSVSTKTMTEFVLKHRLYDLLVMIAKHAIHYEDRRIQLCLSPSEHPINVESLMELWINNPPLFNRLASDGDINFMKQVHHLMPEYVTWTYNSRGPYQQLFDNQLLQCALSGGHYLCALYILDNITQFLQAVSFKVDKEHQHPKNKWIVTGVNMGQDHGHNWLE